MTRSSSPPNSLSRSAGAAAPTTKCATWLLAPGLLVLGSLAGCGGQAEQSAPAPSPSAEQTLVQLCGVLESALAGDLDTVRSTFDHGPLHAIADATTDVDRRTAARLLEAKEAIESDLANPATNTATMAADLETLIAATTAALEATGTAAPSTCDQENP